MAFRCPVDALSAPKSFTALIRCRELDHRHHRVALARVIAHQSGRHLRAAGAEPREVFDPVVGFGGNKMQPRHGERLAVSECGAGRDFT